MSTSSQSSEQKPNTARTRPVKPLTRKQQAFVQAIVQNPHTSATRAYKQAYGDVTDGTARTEASRSLANPNIQSELAKYERTAEDTIVKVLNYSGEMMVLEKSPVWGNLAKSTADSLLDRTRGKAIQRTENTSTTVSLSLNLTDVIPKE